MLETPSENFADKCKQNNIWMEHFYPLKSIFIIQKPKFLKILKKDPTHYKQLNDLTKIKMVLLINLRIVYPINEIRYLRIVCLIHRRDLRILCPIL